MGWGCGVVVGALALAGCGRIAFDRAGDATPDSNTDGSANPDALPADLVAWFSLDAVPAADGVGAGAGTCTATACPTLTTGPRAGALSFDGVDDCLVVADYAALDQATFTVAMWARPSVNQDSACVAKRVDVGTNPADSWELGVGATDDLELTTEHTAGTDQLLTPDAAVTIGQWQHVAFTWDGATKRVYIDGMERASRAGTGPLSYDGHAGMIGCDDNGGPVRFFNGVLDDVQIYSRALTAGELAQLAAP